MQCSQLCALDKCQFLTALISWEGSIFEAFDCCYFFPSLFVLLRAISKEVLEVTTASHLNISDGLMEVIVTKSSKV